MTAKKAEAPAGAATKSDATPAGSGGKTAGAAQAKADAKAAAPKQTQKKRQVQKRGDQTPEAKSTQAEKKAAAEKMFRDADEASLVGLPPDMTHEQNENRLRRSALGY
jgi:hypothetical protein